MRPFIPPGSTQQTPQPTQSYRQPAAALQQTPPMPSPETTPTPQGEPAHANDPHRALLTEWQRHHGSNWTRADALHPTVRRMIDERDRAPAIRQKLRLLAATCPEIEAKVVGNAAKPTRLYRLVSAGLEG